MMNGLEAGGDVRKELTLQTNRTSLTQLFLHTFHGIYLHNYIMRIISKM